MNWPDRTIRHIKAPHGKAHNAMSQFLTSSEANRFAAFTQAADRLGISTVVIEKDFWVCWILSLLFADPELAPHLVFKGGTSLSKVFNAIDRFSEDVDLSLSPSFVGADIAGFEKLTSRTKRDKAVVEMQRLCGVATERHVMPGLDVQIRNALGNHPGRSWLTYELDPQGHSPVILFHYPKIESAGLPYIPPSVKLELGSLTDQQPTGSHPVRPWVADVFPHLFEEWTCLVTALDLGRSFWEKATILHANFHRPADQPVPARYARHYADFARLVGHKSARELMGNEELCLRVADWKQRVFASGWARYDLARAGTLRLAPPESRRQELARDYEAMRPMFLVEPPPFEDVLRVIAEAEAMINGG